MTQAVGEKRGAQVALIFDRLLPKGYVRETFAGKKAAQLTAARSRSSAGSSRPARRSSGPGRRLGIVQDGKVVFSGASACGASEARRRSMATPY